MTSQPCEKWSSVRATWREQRLGIHARELSGWRSVREGSARVKRWQTWTAHSESLTQKGHTTWHVAARTVTRHNKHVHARSHSLTHSLKCRAHATRSVRQHVTSLCALVQLFLKLVGGTLQAGRFLASPRPSVAPISPSFSPSVAYNTGMIGIASIFPFIVLFILYVFAVRRLFLHWIIPAVIP